MVETTTSGLSDSIGRTDPGHLAEQRVAIMSDDVVYPLIQAMPGYVMLLNRQRQIVVHNDRLREISGASSHESLVGMRAGEALNCVHSDDVTGGCGTGRYCSVCGAVLAIAESQLSGQQETRECHVTLGGIEEAVLDMQATATPVVIAGEPFTVFVLQDISSEKRREVLERVFFHDIINTAGSIHGLASIMAEQDGIPTRLETEYKSWLVRLSGSLVDEIRSQRKLLAAETGEFVPERLPVEVRSVLTDVYQLYHHYEKTPGRHLEIADGPECTITSDASVIRRILCCMTLNALEASPVGSVVTISARIDEDRVVYEVHNPGEIPGEIQLQMFKRSFSTKSVTGRGIGTYSMKLFGERYLNGSVAFRSDRDNGTVFSFSLPLDR